MDPLIIAIIVAVFTLIVLFSGIPIAFGLSFVSIALLVAFEGLQMLDVFAETFYAGLNSFVLLSIPMFILMGMAVANSPAGKDLYTGLDRWLWRLPGGLVISNIGACSIFAALSGSSPATCAAIGTMGIPEMRKRGYSDQIATGTIAAGGIWNCYRYIYWKIVLMWFDTWFYVSRNVCNMGTNTQLFYR